MNFLYDPTMLLIFLAIALIVLAYVWFRGDPEIESPRSQMRILEEALRNRGFRPMIKMVRDFENYKEGDFLRELQDMMVQFSQDREFVHDWLGPILLKNMDLIMKDKTLFMQFDLALREHYGYRLKPIEHKTYGIRPEVTFHATSEEADVCMKQENEDQLLRGRKVYRQLSEKDEVVIDE